MSLLADLNLSYEMLADDPIEVGIRYGKSILSVVSAKFSPTLSDSYEASDYVRRSLPAQVSEFRSRLVRPTTVAQSRTRPTIDRRNFVDYSARQVPVAPRPVYSQRSLIGVI